MATLLRVFFLFVLTASMASAQTPVSLVDNESTTILNRVKEFYSWVLLNNRPVSALEPRIKEVKGSSKFYLDVSTLKAFSTAFMQHGGFSADFPATVENYYWNYKKIFNQYSRKEFDQIKKNGRGPLMGTEDMDIFFCAQEFEYAQSYIDGMKLTNLKIIGKTASATIVSPYDWQTEFLFKKVGSRWLISGYCVYK